jgi:hypothetical protein
MTIATTMLGRPLGVGVADRGDADADSDGVVDATGVFDGDAPVSTRRDTPGYDPRARGEGESVCV